MAKVNIGLKEKKCNLEVGDIVINPRYGARMIIAGNGKYFGVDLERGHICGSGELLSDLEAMYCDGEFRILKSDDIEVSEVGGRI